jgi:hypothetical protein
VGELTGFDRGETAAVRLTVKSLENAMGDSPFRLNCGYQQSQYRDLNIPVGMLDNDFRNPDLDRYVIRFFRA